MGGGDWGYLVGLGGFSTGGLLGMGILYIGGALGIPLPGWIFFAAMLPCTWFWFRYFERRLGYAANKPWLRENGGECDD